MAFSSIVMPPTGRLATLVRPELRLIVPRSGGRNRRQGVRCGSSARRCWTEFVGALLVQRFAHPSPPQPECAERLPAFILPRRGGVATQGGRGPQARRPSGLTGNVRGASKGRPKRGPRAGVVSPEPHSGKDAGGADIGGMDTSEKRRWYCPCPAWPVYGSLAVTGLLFAIGKVAVVLVQRAQGLHGPDRGGRGGRGLAADAPVVAGCLVFRGRFQFGIARCSCLPWLWPCPSVGWQRRYRRGSSRRPWPRKCKGEDGPWTTMGNLMQTATCSTAESNQVARAGCDVCSAMVLRHHPLRV